VISAIFVLVISCGAIAAGAGYVRTSRRMRTFATTRGTVTGREVVRLPGAIARDARWGKGGGWMPKVTYTYVVDGMTCTSDRLGYAYRGFRHSIAERQLGAIPDEVDVLYDPRNPQEAYLERHRPALGVVLVAGGIVGVLGAVIALLAR
jgi:hypothetical protein